MRIKTSVRYLQAGDVLTGSGFTVTRNPFTSVRCPKGKLWVEGVASNGRPVLKCWGASTTMTVERPERDR